MSAWLSQAQFSAACDALPLVSVDLYLTRSGVHGQELLLGLRNNHPAQGWWFTPGGRIRKNEPLAQAFRRIANDEIGLQVSGPGQFIGVWDHFDKDSAFDAHVSTHDVNLAFLCPLTDDQIADLNLATGQKAQHADWRWMTLSAAAAHESVHDHVRAVIKALSSGAVTCGFMPGATAFGDSRQSDF